MIGLNFHGIGTPARDLDTGEASYWLEETQFTAILDRVAAAPNRSTYALTFDDGNLSDYLIALPALAARGLRATFFVLSGRFGQAGSLDRDHVTALQRAGMEIGSHGAAHLPWTGLDDAELTAELESSRAELEAVCGQAVTEAGIPFGHYDARVLRALRQAGYEAAWSSDGGTFSPQEYLRPRTSLRCDMAPSEIDTILAGRMPLGRRLRRSVGMAKRRWLPLTR